MKSIFFDYKIDLQTVALERREDIVNYDIEFLKGSLNGRIYIFFHTNDKKNRNFMLLKTGIIDYLLQFDMFFSNEIEDGEKINLVSCDYYSNSLTFKYVKSNGNLNIWEVNGGVYEINCKYKDFKASYQEFREKVISEIVVFYPELLLNSAFIGYFIPAQRVP